MKKWLIFGLLLLSSGCRIIEVDIPPSKRVRYYTFGNDTKIGSLHIKTPEGSELTLENLDSSSQALSIAAKALEIAHPMP